MRIGLFVPCCVDAFRLDAGIATLERLGSGVDYARDQTCCGQPMANTGCREKAAATEACSSATSPPYDVAAAPPASCVHQVRCTLDAVEQTEEVEQVRAKTFGLVEFLHDTLHVEAFSWAEFPRKVALHHNCNSLRGLSITAEAELGVNTLGYLPQHLIVTLSTRRNPHEPDRPIHPHRPACSLRRGAP